MFHSQKTTHEVSTLFQQTFLNEGLRLLEERACSPKTLEAVCKENFELAWNHQSIMGQQDVIKKNLQDRFNQSNYDPRFRPASISQETSFTEIKVTHPLKPSRLIIEGDMGAAAVLVERFHSAGLEIQIIEPEDSVLDRLIVGHTHLMLSPGLLATEYQASLPWEEENEALVLFDLSRNFETSQKVCLSPSLLGDEEHWAEAVGLFQTIGIESHIIEDTPALISARLLSQLVNVLCDFSLKTGLSYQEMDHQLAKDFNLSYGLFDWADHTGPDYLSAIMENLSRTYGDGRYRNSIALRKLVNAQLYFYEDGA